MDTQEFGAQLNERMHARYKDFTLEVNGANIIVTYNYGGPNEALVSSALNDMGIEHGSEFNPETLETITYTFAGVTIIERTPNELLQKKLTKIVLASGYEQVGNENGAPFILDGDSVIITDTWQIYTAEAKLEGADPIEFAQQLRKMELQKIVHRTISGEPFVNLFLLAKELASLVRKIYPELK